MTNTLLQGIQSLSRRGSIPASVEQSFGNVTLNNTRTATITCKITYGAGATTGATVNLYYSPDRGQFDTVAFASFLVNLNPGNTVQETAILDLPEHGYVEIKVSNGDAAATDVELWYSLARHGDTFVEGGKVVQLLDDINRRLGELKEVIPLFYNTQG